MEVVQDGDVIKSGTSDVPKIAESICVKLRDLGGLPSKFLKCFFIRSTSLYCIVLKVPYNDFDDQVGATLLSGELGKAMDCPAIRTDKVKTMMPHLVLSHALQIAAYLKGLGKNYITTCILTD